MWLDTFFESDPYFFFGLLAIHLSQRTIKIQNWDSALQTLGRQCGPGLSSSQPGPDGARIGPCLDGILHGRTGRLSVSPLTLPDVCSLTCSQVGALSPSAPSPHWGCPLLSPRALVTGVGVQNELPKMGLGGMWIILS